MNIFILLSIFFVYIATVSNTIFGGDAGDLLSAILTKGFAHPPGYPLYTILGIFFNSLPLNFTPAGKITLISTFATVFSLILFILIVKQIASRKYYNPAILAAVTLMIGFNYVVWLYGIVPEVFPLNTLIILLLFYCAIKWHLTLEKKYLYLLFFFIGLGITHHHTFILLTPSLIYLFYAKRKSIMIKKSEVILTVLCLIAGLLPLIYLPFAYFFRSEVLWANTHTWSGFFDLLTRRTYGSFLAGSFVSNMPLHRLLQIKNIFHSTVNDMTPWSIVFSLAGVVFLFTLKKSEVKTILVALLCNVFFFGPFFFFYANFPLSNDLFFATVERFFIVYYFFLGMLIYFGVCWLYTIARLYLIDRFTQKPFLKQLTGFLILGFVFFIPVHLFMRNYPLIRSLKNDQTAENFGRDVLRTGEQNSLMILLSDQFIFNAQYIYYAYPHLRNGVTLIHPTKWMINSDYPNIIRIHYPTLQFVSPDRTHNTNFQIEVTKQIITPNMKKYDAIYSDLRHPLDALKEYVWIPQGLIYKLVKKDSLKNSEHIRHNELLWEESSYKKIAREFKNKNPKFAHFLIKDMLMMYALSHRETAEYYLAINQNVRGALRHINSALFINPNDHKAFFLLSAYYMEIRECKKSEEAIEKAIALDKTHSRLYPAQLATIAEKCYKEKKDKERIKKKLEELQKSILQPLEKF